MWSRFNTSKNRITSKSFKNMLLTPSLYTALYTQYTFLPRCVPVPCELRGCSATEAMTPAEIVSTVSIWSGTLSSSAPPGMNHISTGIRYWILAEYSVPSQGQCRLPSQGDVVEINLQLFATSRVSLEAQNSQGLSSQTFSTFFCMWMRIMRMYKMYIDMYFSLKSSLTYTPLFIKFFQYQNIVIANGAGTGTFCYIHIIPWSSLPIRHATEPKCHTLVLLLNEYYTMFSRNYFMSVL